MTIKQRVLHGLGWLVAGRGIAQTIRWIATIYVIRLLAPEDYGIVAVATVLFGLMIRLCDAGFGNAVVVSDDTDDRTLGEFFGFLLLVSTGLGLVHLLSAPLLAAFFNEPRIIPVMQVLSMGFVFTSLSIIPSALLTKKMRFKRVAISSSIATLTGTAVTVTLAYKGYAFWSLIIGQLVTQLAVAIVFMIGSKVLDNSTHSSQGNYVSHIRGQFHYRGKPSVVCLHETRCVHCRPPVELNSSGLLHGASTPGPTASWQGDAVAAQSRNAVLCSDSRQPICC